MPATVYKHCPLCGSDLACHEFDTHIQICRDEEVNCTYECGKSMSRSMLLQHLESDCERRLVSCQFCYTTCRLQDMRSHEEQCGSRNVSPPLVTSNSVTNTICYFCSKVLCSSELEEHNQKCNLVLESCDKCDSRIQRQYMVLHQKDNCIKRIVECQYCRNSSVADVLHEHLELCEMFPIYCHNKCGKEMVRKEISKHVHEECVNRLVKCENCRLEVVADAVEKHNESCMKRPILCPEGCNSYIVREDMQNHVTEKCPTLFKKCSYSDFGCQYEGFPPDLCDHMQAGGNFHMDLMKNDISRLHKVIEKQQRIMDIQQLELEESREEIELLKQEGDLISKLKTKVMELEGKVILAEEQEQMLEVIAKKINVKGENNTENKCDISIGDVFYTWTVLDFVKNFRVGNDYIIRNPFATCQSNWFKVGEHNLKIHLNSVSKLTEAFTGALHGSMQNALRNYVSVSIEGSLPTTKHLNVTMIVDSPRGRSEFSVCLMKHCSCFAPHDLLFTSGNHTRLHNYVTVDKNIGALYYGDNKFCMTVAVTLHTNTSKSKYCFETCNIVRF